MAECRLKARTVIAVTTAAAEKREESALLTSLVLPLSSLWLLSGIAEC